MPYFALQSTERSDLLFSFAKDSFFNHFQAIIYTFIDGSQLNQQNPGRLLGMEWVSDCTVEDGAIQRLFVAHSKAEGDKPERIMLCTYPFEKVSHTILKCSRLLLNWFLLSTGGFKMNDGNE